MKYKAFIFDMDGTITDSEHIWKQATRQLITKRSGEPSKELLKELESKVRGSSLDKSCTVIKDMLDLDHDLLELMEEKKRHAVELMKEGMEFIEGFENFHKKVLGEQVMVGIATNADDHTLETSKQKLALDKYFGEHIYNITHVDNKAKPDPALFLHAAQQLGVDPEYCVVFEDSAHGVRAAKRAGMFCVGINSAKNRDALQECDLIVDRYEEIDLERLLRRKGIKKISE